MSSVSPVFRRTALTALAAGAALSLSACGAITSLLGGGNVFELNVGDCFSEDAMNNALGGEEVSDVPLVDCAESHDAEIFHAFDMEGDDYPGDEAVSTAADEACYGQPFTDFIGLPYEESVFGAGVLFPTEQTWNQLDDREIVCYVVSAGEPVEGTLADSNR